MKNKINMLVISAMLIAIAFVFSNIKIWKMPFGGSITLFSMFIIVLPGYFYTPVIGLISAFIYSLLQLIFGGYVVSIPQVLFDYIFAFTSLGFFGFLYKKNNSLILSYSVSVLFRLIFSIISGYVFFKDYAPETMNPILYTIVYNGSYICGEMIITDIILLMPNVKNKLEYFKNTI